MRVSITLKRGGRHNQGRARISRTRRRLRARVNVSPRRRPLFFFAVTVQEIYPAGSVTAPQHEVHQSRAGSNRNGRTGSAMFGLVGHGRFGSGGGG
jgi:hypothetical protein